MYHVFWDTLYIRFGTKLNREIVGIPMGTNCAPLVADSFLFCYNTVGNHVTIDVCLIPLWGSHFDFFASQTTGFAFL